MSSSGADIVIEPNGDLTIALVTRDKPQPLPEGVPEFRRPVQAIHALFKVSKKVIEQNSEVLKKHIAQQCTEGEAYMIEIEEQHVEALQLWFRHMHNLMTEVWYNVDLMTVAQVIDVQYTYLFHLEKLESWFAIWMRNVSGAGRNLPDEKPLREFGATELRSVMYFCHEFDHAQGFADATKRLAYEVTAHITENLLTDERLDLHLPQRIIGALNAAKGNLKTKLHKGLYIHTKFLNSQCRCRKDGMYEYERALHTTGVWPLTMHMYGRDQKSIDDIIEGLSYFSFHSPNANCGVCGQDLRSNVVNRTCGRVENSFDGLCLDCIDNPRPSRFDPNDEDSDWRDWSKYCRIRHRQPSAYFSYLARMQEPDDVQKRRQERKAHKEYSDRMGHKRRRDDDEDGDENGNEGGDESNKRMRMDVDPDDRIDAHRLARRQ